MGSDTHLATREAIDESTSKGLPARHLDIGWLASDL
jgi:hypothetical protein